MCQGFSHFSGFWLYFVLAKLANSSIRVKKSAIRSSSCTSQMHVRSVCVYSHHRDSITTQLSISHNCPNDTA